MKTLFRHPCGALCLALTVGLAGCADSKTTPVAKQKNTTNEKPSTASTNSYANREKPAVASNKTIAKKPKTDVAAFIPRSNGKRSDTFPNILLQTHDGKSVRFYDDLVKDHVVVVNFMYTTCTGI